MPLPTLGIYAPLPGSRSGIADYAQYTASALADSFDVSFVSLSSYVPPAKFDHVLYHVGNGVDSAAAFRAMGDRSGPVILHEYVLSQFFIETHALLDELTNERVRRVFSAVCGYAFNSSADLDRLMRTERERELHYLDVGIERLIVERALRVFVHSRVSFEVLRGRYGHIVRLLDFPVEPVPRHKRESVRAALGIPSSATVFGSFGFVGTNKRLAVILEAWAAMDVDPMDAHLLIAGFGATYLRQHCEKSVTSLDYIPAAGDFADLLGIVDVCIQLRSPTLGETSGVASRMLGAGIRAVVSSEEILPTWCHANAIYIVKPDRHETKRLSDVLRRLVRRTGEGRTTIGINAFEGWTADISRALQIE